jgi:hypothetical protein
MRQAFDVTICAASTLDSLRRKQWEAAQCGSMNSATIFQTAEFVAYLSESSGEDSVFLIIVAETNFPERAYFVPVRLSEVTAPWSTRARWLGGLRFPVIEILGGEANMPNDSEIIDKLFTTIRSDKTFGKKTMLMPFLAKDSFVWNYVSKSEGILKNYRPFVLHDFRDSHSIEVPASMNAYNKLLTKKKRYNLMRQERILREKFKENIEIRAIERSGQLPVLFSAMKELNVPAFHESTLSKINFHKSCENGITLCYVMMCDSEFLGLAIGIKSKSIYYVQRFYYQEKLKVYSVGTVLWQMILRDIIENQKFLTIELGYSSPTYNSRTINRICERGEVLLIRKSPMNFAKLYTFIFYSGIVDSLKNAMRATAAATNKLVHFKSFFRSDRE